MVVDNLLIRPYLLGYSFVGGGGTLRNFHETYISDMLWDKCVGMIDKHETTHMLYSNHWSIVGKDYTKCLQDVVLKSTMPPAKKQTNKHNLQKRVLRTYCLHIKSILQPSIAYICNYCPAQTLQHCDSW